MEPKAGQLWSSCATASEGPREGQLEPFVKYARPNAFLESRPLLELPRHPKMVKTVPTLIEPAQLGHDLGMAGA